MRYKIATEDLEHHHLDHCLLENMFQVILKIPNLIKLLMGNFNLNEGWDYYIITI